MSNNRQQLLTAANMVRPAVSNQNYIPILTHIRFDGKMASAYNDIAGLGVRCLLDLNRCVPGDLLIKALGSFKGDSVAFADGKNEALVISSGRSKVTLPTLPTEKFPLEYPRKGLGARVEIALTSDILKGITRCLVSVGADPTHPAQMGVTLDVDEDGKVVLFSTDNFSISRYQTSSDADLPGDAPVILPTFFCEQIARFANAFPDAEAALVIYEGLIAAEFGNDLGWVLQKTLVDLEPLDFPAIVKKHVDLGKLKKQLVDIPPGFDDALERALLVLSQQVDKQTQIKVDDAGMRLYSSSDLGEADDRLKFDGDDADFLVDPSYLARAAKSCSVMACLPRTVVMADEKLEFLHLISHVSK